MKKLLFILFIFLLVSFLATTASSAGASPAAQTELGQLKVCKAGGSGVTQGQLFTIRVGSTNYSVPAGYCVLAGQFALDTQVAIQEIIPNGYDVLAINVRPDSRVVSRDLPAGSIVVRIGSGVTEVIYTNWPTGVSTPTPRPTSTPNTGTPEPTGRLQICKEAADPGVTGDFMFRFQSRSFRIPVGACSVLVHADVGTLTITEDARSGYVLEDVYTIPAGRLISKDLNGRSATVNIVQGTAASQTVIVFRNRSLGTTTPTVTNTPTATPTITVTGSTPTPSHTPTPTVTGSASPTPTNTATSTPTPTGSPTPTPTGTITCTPAIITADFSQIAPGGSVEGLNVVAQNLNIDAVGTAVKVAEGVEPPRAYIAPNAAPGVTPAPNAGLAPGGGFSDIPPGTDSGNRTEPHHYTFTFAQPVNFFTLRMLDFGDLNMSFPLTPQPNHYASMTAYGKDAQGNLVPISGPFGKQELDYTTGTSRTPRNSNLYGDLFFNGDAVTAPRGQPGNWVWSVAGNGIVQVVLEFGDGWDPNIAFDSLAFSNECGCQSLFTTDLSRVAAGQSVEGLNTIGPDLNINANYGTAVRVVEGQVTPEFAYLAPNAAPGVTPTPNGGLAPDGGFTDLDAKRDGQPHKYTFTFTPGKTITFFALHMLDYGDWNPTLSASHSVNITAYGRDAQGNLVPISNQYGIPELRYTTDPAVNTPRTSSLYGDLFFNGDAVTAPRGQPGNWFWIIAGNGIEQVVLEFGEGYDPNVAFDLLYYNVVCIQ